MARLWLYQGQPVTCSHLDGTCLETERERQRQSAKEQERVSGSRAAASGSMSGLTRNWLNFSRTGAFGGIFACNAKSMLELGKIISNIKIPATCPRASNCEHVLLPLPCPTQSLLPSRALQRMAKKGTTRSLRKMLNPAAAAAAAAIAGGRCG